MVLPGEERVGVLVLRVWLESAEPGPSLRARITETTDVRDEQREHSVAVAGTDDACATVCRWLRHFAGAETADQRDESS
jgi:hypothetical protein